GLEVPEVVADVVEGAGVGGEVDDVVVESGLVEGAHGGGALHAAGLGVDGDAHGVLLGFSGGGVGLAVCLHSSTSATSGARGVGGLIWSFSGVRRGVCGALVRSVPLSLTPADLGVERTGSRMGTRAGGKKSGRNKR